jgi:hypothetical protein
MRRQYLLKRCGTDEKETHERGVTGGVNDMDVSDCVQPWRLGQLYIWSNLPEVGHADRCRCTARCAKWKLLSVL